MQLVHGFSSPSLHSRALFTKRHNCNSSFDTGLLLLLLLLFISFVTVSAGVFSFISRVHTIRLWASDTQVVHSNHTLSTFLRIRADTTMLIFWVSVTLALSDTLLMFSTIPFFIVPSAPTTTGITSVFICHILCISNSRSLYLLFFFDSFQGDISV